MTTTPSTTDTDTASRIRVVELSSGPGRMPRQETKGREIFRTAEDPMRARLRAEMLLEIKRIRRKYPLNQMSPLQSWQLREECRHKMEQLLCQRSGS